MKKFLLRVVFVGLCAALGFLAWRNAQLRRQVASAAAPPVAAAPATPVTAAQHEDTRRVIERETAALRELEFKKPVTYKTMPRAALREYLMGKVREQFSAQELRDYERTLATVGFIPEGTDLLDVYLSMFDEQVAAFYVPEERALYTFEEQLWSSNLDKMFLAHELTHALQDQNYDLLTFPLKLKNNDDRVLATSALLEGDATLLMTRWYVETLGSGKMLDDVAQIFRQNTAKLRAAPAFLRQMLIFPYQEGAQFVTALYAAGGAKALDEAFRHPPTSTHEILHPEKFLKDRQPPVAVTLPAVATNEWRVIGDNVAGEFGVRVLLEQKLSPWQSQLVAQGWRGDQFRAYERGTNGPTALVWASAWDDETAAIDFAEAYTKLAQGDTNTTWQVKTARDGTRVTIWKTTDASFLEPLPANP